MLITAEVKHEECRVVTCSLNMLDLATHANASAGGPYSATVTLPVTDFSLRANSVVREPQIQVSGGGLHR